MRRTACRVLIAAGLMTLGWVAGSSQASQPDFELVINSPQGETTVECRRGCALAWVERGDPAARTPMPTFSYACTGGGPGQRCSSARIGGWIKR
jgi:hypothetical protein